jgi:hypothetical protein
LQRISNEIMAIALIRKRHKQIPCPKGAGVNRNTLSLPLSSSLSARSQSCVLCAP